VYLCTTSRLRRRCLDPNMRAQLSGGEGAKIRIDPRKSHAQTCFVACPLVCRGNAVARVRGKASSPSQDHDGRTRRPKCGYLAPHSRFLLGQIAPRLSDNHITRSYWPRDFFADARAAFRIQRMKIGNYDTIVFGRRVFARRVFARRLRWLGGG
jgi:hypothetical protein